MYILVKLLVFLYLILIHSAVLSGKRTESIIYIHITAARRADKNKSTRAACSYFISPRGRQPEGEIYIIQLARAGGPRAVYYISSECEVISYISTIELFYLLLAFSLLQRLLFALDNSFMSRK